MSNYTISEIKASILEFNPEFPWEGFIYFLNKKEQEKRQEEENKPLRVEIQPEDNISEEDISGQDDVSISDLIRDAVACNGEESVYFDMFRKPEGLPDSGANGTIYFKAGDKFYQVDIHCEAEWVGDWSVRKNLPGDVTATKIIELTDFTIEEENKLHYILTIPNKNSNTNVIWEENK